MNGGAMTRRQEKVSSPWRHPHRLVVSQSDFADQDATRDLFARRDFHSGSRGRSPFWFSFALRLKAALTGRRLLF